MSARQRASRCRSRAHSRFPTSRARAPPPRGVVARPRPARAGRPASSAAEEPALERAQQLVADERLHRPRPPVLLRYDSVVLERLVGSCEGIIELVPLEQIVVGPWLVARAVLRIDAAPDRPEATRPPLDPDHDPFGRASVVDAVDLSLREPAGGRPALHADYSIGCGPTLQSVPEPVLVPRHALEQRGACPGIPAPGA